MDLIYRRYSNPLELMNLYINNGEFGLFVTNIINLEAKRKEEEVKSLEEQKLWELYLHSMSDKSFVEWKEELINPGNSNEPNQVTTHAMSNAQVNATINKSRDILKEFNPR